MLQRLFIAWIKARHRVGDNPLFAPGVVLYRAGMPTAFTSELFVFLTDLRRHNDRAWFERNKERYEEHVRGPALRFIAAFSAPLATITRQLIAEPKKSGGSLFRIHRDTRFSRDKTPYKTQVGMQFRHRAGGDAHAPCFYLHLEPGNCFVGAGIWHPEPAVAQQIRAVIAAQPKRWQAAAHDRAVARRFALDGDSLRRVPRPYPADHPLAEDLRRKDFILVGELTDREVLAPGFLRTFSERCRLAAPFTALVCRAVGLPF